MGRLRQFTKMGITFHVMIHNSTPILGKVMHSSLKIIHSGLNVKHLENVWKMGQ